MTTIVKEYSRAYTGAEGETPYYAIINPENNALYAKYKAEADKKPQLHLLGRLAEYTGPRAVVSGSMSSGFWPHCFMV